MKHSEEQRQATVELLIEINNWSLKKDRATQEVSKSRIIDLISKGADVNGTENMGVSEVVEMTNVVKLAASVGSIDIFNILIDEGAQVNTDVLRIAVSLGYTEIVRKILAKGVEIDGESSIANNRTTMALAAQGGYIDIMTALVKSDGMVNSPDENIIGPLEASSSIKENQISTEVVEVLINAGADINAVGLNNRTPLMRAVLAGQEGVVRILSAALQEQGCDLEARDDLQDTALMLAVRSGNVEMTKSILAAGASADSKDVNGDSVMSLAVLHDDKEILQTLSSGDVDFESKNNSGQTPFMVAVVNKKESAVSWFLKEAEVAVDINTVSQGGWTPLMAAIHYGYFDIVDEMMSHKFQDALDITAVNDENYSATSLAQYHLQNDSSGQYQSMLDLLQARAGIENITEESKFGDIQEPDSAIEGQVIKRDGIKRISSRIDGGTNPLGPSVDSVKHFTAAVDNTDVKRITPKTGGTNPLGPSITSVEHLLGSSQKENPGAKR